MKRLPRPALRCVAIASLAALAGVLCAPGALAQDEPIGPAVDPAVMLEVQYATALSELGMAEYAEMVMVRVKREHPEAENLFKVIELQVLIQQGRFDDVDRKIAAERDQDSQQAWAMKLAKADGLYAWGRYEEARAIYLAFFRKYPDGPPESLRDFFLGSAYKYARMLLLMGDKAGALKAYDDVLKALPKTDREMRHIRRQVLTEMSELCVQLADEADDEATQKKYFDRIEDFCNEILWVQDIWFGKAIVLLGHVRLIQGDIEGASKLVDDYYGQLRDIDARLREQAEQTGEDLTSLSPMAECRFLLGKIMFDEAERLIAEGGDRDRIIELLAGKKVRRGGREVRTSGALQHFLNVFIGYPATSWAPDAGSLAERVESILINDFGATITKNVTPEQMETVQTMQFRAARVLFNQNQFANAADAYLKVINLFPEVEASVPALGELARCYVELIEDDEDINAILADTVVGHLAERFGEAPSAMMSRAGDQLLGIAAMYSQRNMVTRETGAYQRFFHCFPRHALAPATLYRFAERKLAEENYPAALSYYNRIASNYTEVAVYFDALNRAAYCYSELEDREGEIQALGRYIEALSAKDIPGQELINAKYRLASAYRLMAREATRQAREGDEAPEGETVAEGATAAEPEPEPELTEDQRKLMEARRRVTLARQRMQAARATYDAEVAAFREGGDDQEQHKQAAMAARAEHDKYKALAERYAGLAARMEAAGIEAPEETAAAPAAGGDDPLAMAMSQYQDLIDLLNSPERERFEDGDEARTQNQKILEGAIFNLAVSYSMLEPGDAAEAAANKRRAIEMFEQLVTTFPDSEFGPISLSQVGTLWTVLEQPDEAQRAFQRLQKDYPASPEAQNALFMLGMALLDLGRRQQATRVFKDMFAGQGSYSAGQILRAGNELFNAGELDIALEAYEKVLATAEERARLEPALLGKAKVLVELGKIAEGGRVLDEFFEKYPKSGHTVEAGFYLSRARSQEAAEEANDERRFDLFNQAVSAMKRVRAFVQDDPGRSAESDVAVARILARKAAAEEEYGSDARAAEYRGEAVATYQTVIMIVDPADPTVRPHLEAAYAECFPLLFEIERYQDLQEDCRAYLEMFPDGRHSLDARRWQTQAGVKLAQQGGAAPAPAPPENGTTAE